MNKKQGIKNVYKKFCRAEGSQHIASEYAIEKINELVTKFQVKRILELGLGIGSISGIILAMNRHKQDIDYTGTEVNQFCIKALSENLRKDYSRLNIVSDLTKFTSHKKFDLIIIDGNDINLQTLKFLISENGIIAIEGDRMDQQIMLQDFFPKHMYVHCISLKKNKVFSPFSSEHWQSGIKVIFVNPTIKQTFWWLKEICCTKIKYQYPGRYLGGVQNK